VTITLPAHLVPYGAIVESMKTWNVGTIETLADLCVLARLWDRYLKSNVGSNEEKAILAEWQQRAERVGQGCLPALQQLDAAGILGIKDLRTDKWYRPEVVRHDGTLEICIATEAELARSSAAKKTPSRKRSVQKRARKTR
jgi:hypothetical protein